MMGMKKEAEEEETTFQLSWRAFDVSGVPASAVSPRLTPSGKAPYVPHRDGVLVPFLTADGGVIQVHCFVTSQAFSVEL